LTVRLPDDWRRFVESAAANADANETRENLRPDFWVRRFTAEAALKLALNVEELEGFKVYVTGNPALGLMVPASMVDPVDVGLVLVLAEYISAEYVVFYGWIKDVTARKRYTPRAITGRGPLLHVVPLNRLSPVGDLK
tara:strand:- start:48 stop:461 length:414 start_codon:yes stop_codon:yes gene_type:complete